MHKFEEPTSLMAREGFDVLKPANSTAQYITENK